MKDKFAPRSQTISPICLTRLLSVSSIVEIRGCQDRLLLPQHQGNIGSLTEFRDATRNIGLKIKFSRDHGAETPHTGVVYLLFSTYSPYHLYHV